MNPEDILNVVHGKQHKLLKAAIRIYGGSPDAILNALHEMAARIAVATNIEPEDFAAGVKHHWDQIAEIVNSDVRSHLS
jgi:hypothetical protein